MNPSGKKWLQRCGFAIGGVIGLLILYVLLLLLLESIFGGPHSISAGQSHGFRIGMTKKEVLDKYRSLNECANLRTISTNGMDDGSVLILERSELLLTPKLQASGHWMAYRSKFPIHFQEFHFSGNTLTNITTYIRFYETP